MKKILFYNYQGKPIKADLVFAFTCKETNKNYIVVNNSDLVFSENSSYNNLDILEVIKEQADRCYVTNVLDSQWNVVQEYMLNEIFATLKSNY